MKRKPTFTTFGPVASCLANDTDVMMIAELASELRELLDRCRVNREARKRFVALLSDYDYFAASGTVDTGCIVDDFVAALATFAPPHAWFGERGGEWGFWPSLWEAGVQCLVSDDPPELLRGYWGNDDCYIMGEQGNVACGRFDKRGRWHEYWECGLGAPDTRGKPPVNRSQPIDIHKLTNPGSYSAQICLAESNET